MKSKHTHTHRQTSESPPHVALLSPQAEETLQGVHCHSTAPFPFPAMPHPSALPVHPDPSAHQDRPRPSICPYPSIPPSPWGRTQHRDPISRLLPDWRCKATSPLGPNGGNYMSMAPGTPWCEPGRAQPGHWAA